MKVCGCACLRQCTIKVISATAYLYPMCAPNAVHLLARAHTHTCTHTHTLFVQATNKEQNITIKSSGGLSEAEIDQMVRDAENFSADDKKRKAGIEAKNEAETELYSAEKSLAEYKV
jgi:molecular chaperone DnaK (HSP70)